MARAAKEDQAMTDAELLAQPPLPLDECCPGYEVQEARARELRAVEDRLEARARARGNEGSWIDDYLDIADVEERGLWRGTYQSMRAWLVHMAVDRGVSEQLLYKRKTAGEYLAELRDQAPDPSLVPTVARGRAVPVSPDNLMDVRRISHGDPEVGAAWVARLASGEASRRDVLAAKRIDREQGGHVRTSRHDQEEDTSQAMAPGDAAGIEATEKALLDALEREATELVWGHDQPTVWPPALAGNRVCALLRQYPIAIPGARSMGRIDGLVVHNLTSARWTDVELHGVEVKVDERDLARDAKTGDYARALDRISYLVPEALVPQAAVVAPPEVGVMAWDPHRVPSVRVAREARRLDPEEREAGLSVALVKALQR